MEIKKISIEGNKVRLFAIYRALIDDTQFKAVWWSVRNEFFKIDKLTVKADEVNRKFIYQVELIGRIDVGNFDKMSMLDLCRSLLDSYKYMFPITNEETIKKLEETSLFC